MKLSTVAGVVLAALVLTGTAAALPGNAPAQADEHATDHGQDQADAADRTDRAAGENLTDADDRAEAADAESARSDEAADQRRGPPSDLPAHVPDFVGQIHDAVDAHVAGDADGSLGDRISDLTPGDDSSSDADGDDPSTDADGDNSSTDGDDVATETAA